MAGIYFKQTGDFEKTLKYLDKLDSIDVFRILQRYGDQGVVALSNATPLYTGLAASSWSYNITKGRNGYSITWYNSDVENGANVVILLQYGHGTKSGTWVEGRDYINPVMRPIFDQISENLWKEVTSL
jgi:hypothetical protein